MTDALLTPRQYDALEAVRRIGEDGWPVETRHVAAALGCSVSPAHLHLKALEQVGLIERNPRGDGWRSRQTQGGTA